ncbi:MAG: GlsB/YeaQ/YmgE family stress response membrane protein [Hyphomicrobium sp.]|nr:GlsB/YeaQ/YmgE family stress response membrane protein [Rhodospirillum sp.]MBA4172845.1 GlsB/YeaQ/YmgE family stress response membrane protein [Hyphomicrobium sp.]
MSNSQIQSLIVFAVIGIAAGFLASILVGGGGLIRYLVTGVVGAFVGGYLLNALGVNLGIRNPLVSQIATATIGAIVVVLLARLIA